jgi:urea transport system ATP-binding protein
MNFSRCEVENGSVDKLGVPRDSRLLELEKVEVSIGGSSILRGVDLQITAPRVVCLMGRNGVGKSTTLKTITGLYRPIGGRIRFNGEDIGRLRPDQRAQRGIAYVPQGREIFPPLTVRENLELGMIACGTEPSGDFERVFTLFPVLREFLSRRGGMLSGGQQQQLAIARALLMNPKLLILDEPTEGIQPNVIDQISDAITLLRKEGEMSILLVEQYVDFARELADDFYIMNRGSTIASGPIEELSETLVREHLTF